MDKLRDDPLCGGAAKHYRSAERADRGCVFNVERYAAGDGPGIRTVVFLKGCALRCIWCSNPESQRPEKEKLFFKNLCINCGICRKVCPRGAVLADAAYGYITDRGRCIHCGLCLSGCVSGAQQESGGDSPVEDIMQLVERDIPFYKASGGGVTLSGGEPFLQGAFTRKLLRACKAKGISTAVESCGHAPWKDIERSLDDIDYLYFDIKHVDEDRHRRFTGSGTSLIHRNLMKIDAHGGPKVVLRIPFIPGFNGDEKSIRKILGFVARLKRPDHVEILPYHRLGLGKYGALGREYKLKDLQPAKAGDLLFYRTIGKEYGLEVTIEAK
jgi:pyruvate formate lyase activating enzyme